MRSLVWKFWLVTWLAIIGTVVAAILVVSQWHRFEQYLAVEAQPRVLLRQLALELEAAMQRGEDIQPLLADHPLSQFGRVYLIDPSGKDYLGQVVPEQIALGASSRPSVDSVRLTPPIVAHTIQAGDERSYFMMFAFERGANPLWMMFRYLGLGWVIVASLLISGAISGSLARLVARPINHLAAVSARHSKGDLDAKADERYLLRHDEIGRLARQLEESARRIKLLLQRQKEFWRDISHEVRAPLARLQLAAETVEVDASDQRAIRQIQLEVNTIDRMVQNLLDLSRADAAITREPKRFDVVALLRDCEQTISIVAKKRLIDIHLDADPPGRDLFGDVDLLKRLVANVLDNALRYSPEGSRIQIVGSASDSYYRISVHDQGPGVPASRLQEIFEPFVRVDPSRGRDTGGFGIGLALVKSIATMHGGRVTASNAEPTGLKVDVALPFGRPAGELAA